MKCRFMTSIMVAVSMLAIIGCGGGGSPEVEEVTKVIMDDPIVGLGYTCSRTSAADEKKFTDEDGKFTDEDGKFTCLEGDNVTFYLGKYKIGSTSVSSGTADTMRIADLMEESNESAVTDVRQLLQTIDSSEGDGKIEIPDDFNALDEVVIKPGESGFDGNVTKALIDKGVLEEGKNLVSEEDANKNANEAYSKHLLAGKTFYAVEIGSKCDTVDMIIINEDATEVRGEEETMKLSFNETEVILEQNGVKEASAIAVKDGYLEFKEFNKRLYYKEADAEAYKNSLGECVVLPPDTTKPVITLNGASSIEITQGTVYEELGATATDDRDGNVTVAISGTVDIKTVGSYTVAYTAKDSAGNEATITRVVTVVLPPDTTKPVITLNGASSIEITQGTVYEELGATATDDRDGNVTVAISGTVDIKTVGSYTVAYTAKDSAGNEATVTRTVSVITNEVLDDFNITSNSCTSIKLIYIDKHSFVLNGTTYRNSISGEVICEDGETIGELNVTYTDSQGNMREMDQDIYMHEEGRFHISFDANYTEAELTDGRLHIEPKFIAIFDRIKLESDTCAQPVLSDLRFETDMDKNTGEYKTDMSGSVFCDDMNQSMRDLQVAYTDMNGSKHTIVLEDDNIDEFMVHENRYGFSEIFVGNVEGIALVEGRKSFEPNEEFDRVQIVSSCANPKIEHIDIKAQKEEDQIRTDIHGMFVCYDSNNSRVEINDANITYTDLNGTVYSNEFGSSSGIFDFRIGGNVENITLTHGEKRVQSYMKTDFDRVELTESNCSSPILLDFSARLSKSEEFLTEVFGRFGCLVDASMLDIDDGQVLYTDKQGVSHRTSLEHGHFHIEIDGNAENIIPEDGRVTYNFGNSVQQIEAAMVNKTLYRKRVECSDDNTTDITFEQRMVLGENTGKFYSNDVVLDFLFSISDHMVSFTVEGKGTDEKTVTGITSSYVEFEGDSRWHYSKADADNHPDTRNACQ